MGGGMGMDDGMGGGGVKSGACVKAVVNGSVCAQQKSNPKFYNNTATSKAGQCILRNIKSEKECKKAKWVTCDDLRYKDCHARYSGRINGTRHSIHINTTSHTAIRHHGVNKLSVAGVRTYYGSMF